MTLIVPPYLRGVQNFLLFKQIRQVALDWSQSKKDLSNDRSQNRPCHENKLIANRPSSRVLASSTGRLNNDARKLLVTSCQLGNVRLR